MSGSRAISTLTILSWNVQGEIGISDSRLDKIIDFIRDCFFMVNKSRNGSFDILLLQAVPYRRREDFINKLKDDFGYRDEGIIDTLDWARNLDKLCCQPHHDLNHDRGNIIASRWEGERIPLSPNDQQGYSNFYTNFPEKILQGRLRWDNWGRLEVWNVGIIAGASAGEEKILALKTLTSRLDQRTKKGGRKRPLIVAGDFNTPARETPDGQAVPYGYDKRGKLGESWPQAELKLLKGLNHWGLIDPLRFLHGYEDLKEERPEHYSHITTGHTRKRLDHLFVDSKAFEPEQCFYPISELGEEKIPSDHSPLVARFKVVGE